MSANQYDALLLDKQLCFPLYACSREVIKRYRPHLEKLGLTYPLKGVEPPTKDRVQNAKNILCKKDSV